MTATLVRRRTADSLIEMEDNVPLGRVYVVESAIAPQRGRHIATGVVWSRDGFWTSSHSVDGKPRWLPAELFEFGDDPSVLS